MTIDLRFYFALLVRRLPYILIILSVCTAIGVAIAYTLPPVYRAQAKLLFESGQIPDELAASTVTSTADENLLAIQQRLLTRTNLLELADEFGIYADEPEVTQDGILEEMRNLISIYMPPLLGNTGVVTVSFGASEPEMSAAVTNALVAQILEQSVEIRTAASGSTLDFFEQEVRRLTQEMSLQNGKILEFEEANRDALPESLTYRRTRQAAQTERLLQVDRELASLRDRRKLLTDLYDRTGRLASSVGEMTPEQAQLENLRQELASALVLYSAQNPRVRALQTQVAALEEAVKEQLGVSGEGTLTSFELQMTDIDGQISFLAEQKSSIEAELEALHVSIEATAANSISLSALQSDYANLRVQYDQAVASLADARMGDRIEETDRGQRITVIEPAVPPAFRSEPNRKLVAATGAGVGLLLSAAMMLLLELLNRTIRRPAELVKALGITPFGTVPYMESKEEIRHRKVVIIGIIAGVAIGVPLFLLAVHVFLVPLGTIIAVIAEKVGLGDWVKINMPSISG